MDACKALRARRCRAGPRGTHREAHLIDEVRDAQLALRDAGQRATNRAWLDFDNLDTPAVSIDEHGGIELWACCFSRSGGTWHVGGCREWPCVAPTRSSRGGRGIALIDGNSFYCSCERVFDSKLVRILVIASCTA